MGWFDRWRRAPASGPAPRPRLSYQLAALQGQGTREEQQDAFTFVNDGDVTLQWQRGLLAAVADGMGGMEGGRQAAEAALAGLKAGFAQMDWEGDPSAQLRAIAEDAGQNVYRVLEGDGGTTLVACAIYQERLYWLSVGDSFLFLQRGEGLYRLNRDQNVRARAYLEAIQAGELDRGPADQDPNGPRLSSFLGMPELALAPDQNLLSLPLRGGDQLLLCSDGAGSVLGEGELLDCLRTASVHTACAMIEERIRAYAHPHQDNYTALVIRCGY